KTGIDTMTLTAVSTFTGNLTVSGGTLALSGSGSVPHATVAVDGIFEVSQISSGSTTIGNLSGSGIVSLGSKALTIGTASSSVFSGAIQDGGIGGGMAAAIQKVGFGT